MNDYILTISCPDKRGIVAAVSIFLAEQSCNILDSAQYGDAESGLFFMRVHFEGEEGAPALEGLREAFSNVGARFAMHWEIGEGKRRSRLAIMVSRFGHCLHDLVYRCETGAMQADICAIISNHRDFEGFAAAHGFPFHYLPVNPENKAGQEDALIGILEELDADLVVLARYMQVLSPALCEWLAGRCINIHHSFLPSFKGAAPYRQAHARGVKLIGATAHYVTPNLDEGPIIEQGVERVDHSYSPEDLAALGRDVESVVLARAVRYHVERRVLLNGNKTVVLR